METIGQPTEPGLRRAGWAAFAAAVLTAGLITYGSWVRASGAGLGCPDWPPCGVSAWDRDALIEGGHRLYAGITMLVTLLAAVLAWRARRPDSAPARLLVGAFLLILVQAALGGATVITELHGMVRLAHLALALSTLALLTAGALRALDVSPSLRPGAGATTAGLLLGAVLIMAGGTIVGTGLSTGCPGLPLCDERSTAMATLLHDAHRTAGLTLLIGHLAAGVYLVRARLGGGPAGTRFAVSLNHVVVPLLLAQGLVGVLTVQDNAATEHLRVIHVALATLIWWALVAGWVLALGAPRR